MGSQLNRNAQPKVPANYARTLNPLTPKGSSSRGPQYRRKGIHSQLLLLLPDAPLAGHTLAEVGLHTEVGILPAEEGILAGDSLAEGDTLQKKEKQPCISTFFHKGIFAEHTRKGQATNLAEGSLAGGSLAGGSLFRKSSFTQHTS